MRVILKLQTNLINGLVVTWRKNRIFFFQHTFFFHSQFFSHDHLMQATFLFIITMSTWCKYQIELLNTV